MKRTFALSVLTICVCFTSACRTQNSTESNIVNIFENDDRIEVRDLSTYPASAMARLESGGNSWCSAFMVAPNIALTNAHCALKEAKLLEIKLQFSRDEFKDSSRIIEVVKGTTVANNRINDWALLVLEKNLVQPGQHFFLDSKTRFTRIPQDTENAYRTHDSFGSHEMMSYPSDIEQGKALVHEKGCQIQGQNFDWNYLYHDCDNRRGASGSPIFYIDQTGLAKVVGVNSAERWANLESGEGPKDGSAYSHRTANLATAIDQFIENFDSLVRKYPHKDETSQPRFERITICNHTGQKVYASIAYKETPADKSLLAKGWYTVDSGCKSFSIRSFGNYYGFAYHWTNARPKPGDGWPKERDREYCVNSQDTFEIDSDRACRRSLKDHIRMPFGLIKGQEKPNKVLEWIIP